MMVELGGTVTLGMRTAEIWVAELALTEVPLMVLVPLDSWASSAEAAGEPVKVVILPPREVPGSRGQGLVPGPWNLEPEN